jgi:inhibitor of KinA sporulation pathway (predicted exonuclease)
MNSDMLISYRKNRRKPLLSDNCRTMYPEIQQKNAKMAGIVYGCFLGKNQIKVSY